MIDAAALIGAVEGAGLHRPVLVLNRDALAANIAYLAAHLPQGYAVRIADKSLPAPDLIGAAMQGLGTDRIMSFHLPITAQVLARWPGADVLMGKPMPAAAAAGFRRDNPHAAQITWLIDGVARLADYRAIAQADGLPMRIAFEVDIGLGRGGFASPDALSAALRDTAPLTVEGLMGYEAHVSALPSILGRGPRAQAAAMGRMRAFIDRLPQEARRILNTGGSSTALTLPGGGPGNELVTGSALVKPSDFDQPCNAALKPALFIVTPALKTVPHGVPGHPRLSWVLRGLRLIGDRITFGYGGKWMAQPIWPDGLRAGPFYGPSSNQQGWVLPRGVPAPDHLILRPTQSEAVIQHFPELQLYEGGQITGTWPVWPPL